MLLNFSHVGWGWGTWTKSSPPPGTNLKTEPIQPSFQLLKAGIFSSGGYLKSVLTQEEKKQTCHLNLETYAWITHRLSKGEILKPESGKLLGSEIKRDLEPGCFQSVSLDIEPMASAPVWLVPFLKELCSVLGPKYPVRLAIPPVSSRGIAGISWLPGEASSLLPYISGLDFMVYDTGLKDSKAYFQVIQENLNFFETTFKHHPTLKLILGLPAYKDKTRNHDLKVENLSNIREYFLSEAAEQNHILCHKQLEIAFYASWTLDGKDKLDILLIEKWRKEKCPQQNPNDSR